jgi:hypothetical protein
MLSHGWWFSLGTPASSNTKTDRHDIAEILLKVALSTKNQIKSNQISKVTSLITEPRGMEYSIQVQISLT